MGLKTETFRKIKTVFLLIKHLPRNISSYINFFKAIFYNIKPSKFKKKKINHKPISITIYINTICNYKCPFCFLITDSHSGSVQKNIQINQFKAILNHPQNINTSRVTIGGGEPFLHKDLFEFIKILNQKNKNISLYTNGSLIGKNIDKIIKHPFDNLNISHYDDYFSKIKNSITNLLKYQIPFRPTIRLSKIISAENISQMEEILDIASEMGIDGVIFQNYFPEKDNEKNLVLLSENKKLKKKKNRLLKKYYSLEIIWPNLVNPNSKFNCQNISLNSTYDSDGNMAPCCFIVPPNSSNGNLFNDIDPWNSSNLIKMRKAYKETSFENEKCSLCYFREGLNNRYR